MSAVRADARNRRALNIAKRAAVAMVCAAALEGCAPGTALGVRLPLGDAGRGREAFVDLHCHACHRIDGQQFPPYPGAAAVAVMLGGHTSRIESYGDIVTSIVNPSHRLARDYARTATAGRESPMANEYLNDVMTVQQLVDLVAFLHTEYEYVSLPPPPYWESYPQSNDTRTFPWGADGPP